ncbi:MAG: lytic murein transglycosylase [Gammaproteobacteria bacterium]
MNIYGLAFATVAYCLIGTPAHALQCSVTANDFQNWIQEYKTLAAQQGISAETLSYLDGLTYATAVIKADRNQRHFNLSFEEFSAKKISGGRFTKGQALLRKHGNTLAQIEARFGVPPEIIVAIWGLETDYGVNMGKLPVLRSLATLAYDCRRSEFFHEHLLAALKIIDRGDKSADDLIGAWAGEIGQAQFLAGNYLAYAVDWDGDGRRDLIDSQPDVLASIASFLAAKGWQAGEDYTPGLPNFDVIKAWNKADVYARTIVAFAKKLAGS